MRSFRDVITKLEKDHHELIIQSTDFYSTSTLKDLIFHVQEHRFTLSQIKDCLSELGLEFCGFMGEENIAAFRAMNPKKDTVYDLDQWQTFEINNPNIFTGMYQFWCQKIIKD